MQVLKHILRVLFFGIVGVLAGIGGKQLYAEWSQPPPTENRDYRAVLAEHGAQVLLFSSSTCPFCLRARETLDQLGISYLELAVDESAEAKAAFDRFGERGVPVLIARDRLIRGYQPEAYRELAAERSRASAAAQVTAHARH